MSCAKQGACTCTGKLACWPVLIAPICALPVCLWVIFSLLDACSHRPLIKICLTFLQQLQNWTCAKVLLGQLCILLPTTLAADPNLCPCSQALVKLCRVNISKAHSSTPIAGKLALMVCIAALHLEQRAVYLFQEGRFQEEQREYLGSISKLQHMLCGLAEQVETALPTFPIPVVSRQQ